VAKAKIDINLFKPSAKADGNKISMVLKLRNQIPVYFSEQPAPTSRGIHLSY
jgi:hypothetical protein